MAAQVELESPSHFYQEAVVVTAFVARFWMQGQSRSSVGSETL
jgi:hypothetical protein